ncbi:polysaccharide biosynthesis protein [Desulfofustis glycolicus]|uniref:NDP-sugar epimerase, includes UDP-GlcNAc-inverting 4,6-dehydratase FlaA1 and capsular polysaccharide biosynthesis protein EpsC n=1 Tax=Desulfofustis glycolicus DSM 9705 TaxID=1121409 RepID=A0A1M5XEY7_9BACT|nr:nucleoside-diphosphate sugar epimerase/dehydratase [Desulfofustis glycolicus]SHH98445.1 NDP-sugar epimerase, includes UDP-GlcNAc-inverting 4,6-dehydratase FlaA1 and capsular polysaccharide biosynthesis protein EpsC [Desulfofustis glycolicus DSM 9705]
MNSKAPPLNLETLPASMKAAVQDHLQLGGLLMRNPKFWMIFSVDLLLLVFALYCSYFLRYESAALVKGSFAPYAAILPVMLLIKLPVFYLFGLYRGMWRYTSTQDLINITKAITVSFILILVALIYINRLGGLSRSVFVLDALLTFLLISGHRVAIRYFYSSFNGSNRTLLPLTGARKPTKKKKLLVIGAGDAAEKVLREFRSNPDLPYLPVGLVDDRKEKFGLKIHGLPVLGEVADLEEHILRTGADEILIAIATASREQMNRFVETCRKTGLPFKAIPGLSEIIDGKVSIKKIRDISIKDLLGREEVVLDQSRIGDYLKDKTVLVTGGGGSIGSELCRQIIRFAPAQMVIFDSSEENLHNMEMELLYERQFREVEPILGRVQDVRLLDEVFHRYRPQVVFHAAAYKHVPLVERNPWEAVYNNIFATQLLIEATIRHQAERFVLVSTDKAVRPTNVMGASKRLTELLMLTYARNTWDGKFCKQWQKVNHKADDPVYQPEPPHHTTRFMAVRFGNVLGSSGSVIPLFKQQIERGGPVTITHPEITRYFMSIEEAAQLILQAGSMGGDGEIFILRMGDPIKIDSMAREMILLAGREPDSDIPIVYTGLRPGEKLYEELITEGEGIVPTEHHKIMVLRNHVDYSFDRESLFNRLLIEAGNHSSRNIKMQLHDIIPEYTPDFLMDEVLDISTLNDQ